MADRNIDDSMLEIYIFETTQNIRRLEQLAIESEKEGKLSQDNINEIFRIMHTIKGSSAMMSHDGIAMLSHRMEDLFSQLRENPSLQYDKDTITDLMIETADIIGGEINNFDSDNYGSINADSLIEKIESVLKSFKSDVKIDMDLPIIDLFDDINSQEEENNEEKPTNFNTESDDGQNHLFHYKVKLFFEEECGMENLRALNIIIHLKDNVNDVFHIPENLDNSTDAVPYIIKNGLTILISTAMNKTQTEDFFYQEVFIKSLSVTVIDNKNSFIEEIEKVKIDAAKAVTNIEKTEVVKDIPQSSVSDVQKINKNVQKMSNYQGMITVNVSKLDELMDMIGELVIAESMVVNNTDLKDLPLPSFKKSAHQLNKITNELQDLAMSMRMVPMTSAFQKISRIMRDMTKKLNKEVKLNMVGENTEVDKNIIDHLSDPMMHLVRNCLDHGIETPEDRISVGKPALGTITIEAKNEGGEVHIIIKDDGKGLNKEKILASAANKGLLKKSEKEMTDKEIYNLVFLPGFSTNEKVTEFSGRGVGMDVVLRNVEDLGGRVQIESTEGKGTQFIIKFPMTLAIIEGMNIRVGESIYTLPITVIKESFKPNLKNIIVDPEKQETVLFRGECYSIIRLHKLYNIENASQNFSDGIFIMIESDENMVCLFADEMLGENQVVVKSLPGYIKKIKGITGCSILGDNKISLILDASELTHIEKK